MWFSDFRDVCEGSTGSHDLRAAEVGLSVANLLATLAVSRNSGREKKGNLLFFSNQTSQQTYNTFHGENAVFVVGVCLLWYRRLLLRCQCHNL